MFLWNYLIPTTHRLDKPNNQSQQGERETKEKKNAESSVHSLLARLVCTTTAAMSTDFFFGDSNVRVKETKPIRFHFCVAWKGNKSWMNAKEKAPTGGWQHWAICRCDGMWHMQMNAEVDEYREDNKYDVSNFFDDKEREKNAEETFCISTFMMIHSYTVHGTHAHHVFLFEYFLLKIHRIFCSRLLERTEHILIFLCKHIVIAQVNTLCQTKFYSKFSVDCMLHASTSCVAVDLRAFSQCRIVAGVFFCSARAVPRRAVESGKRYVTPFVWLNYKLVYHLDFLLLSSIALRRYRSFFRVVFVKRMDSLSRKYKFILQSLSYASNPPKLRRNNNLHHN